MVDLRQYRTPSNLRSSKPLSQSLQQRRRGMPVGLLNVVSQRVDEDDEVRGFELQSMEIRAPTALLVDHVRDNAMGLISVLGLVEPMTELHCHISRRVLSLTRRYRKKGPVDRIKPVSRTVVTQNIAAIPARAARDGEQLNLCLHWRVIDQGWN